MRIKKVAWRHGIRRIWLCLMEGQFFYIKTYYVKLTGKKDKKEIIILYFPVKNK